MPALAKASPSAGLFVAVVGPSGAGKDALIRGLAGRLGDGDGVFAARRVVTRRADAFEDHDTLAEDEFLAAQAQGRFALAWSAHGLRYGVPRDVEARLAAGHAVVCNVSRAVVAEVRRLYRPSLVVLVTARPETLAARLAARGREDGARRRARLARSAAAELAIEADATIHNDGALDEAVARLCELVLDGLRSAVR
jgi:ribose 1,5-bisphosphokinase